MFLCHPTAGAEKRIVHLMNILLSLCFLGPDTNWHLDIVHKIIPVDVNVSRAML